ncbi:MAG: acetylglutamate kinase [Methylacidiphilales bacterium]|nr:acetylglutamate kinase [Candidatus Methylacidiphilales bacterium]
MSKIEVVKIGGNAINEDSYEEVIGALAHYSENRSLVIVHGAGPTIQSKFIAAGFKNTFIDGLRYTPKGSESIIVEALLQQNHALVMSLNKWFVRHGKPPRAVGVNAADSFCIKAEIIDQNRYGMVGTVTYIDNKLIRQLTTSQLLPVIAPYGIDSVSDIVNINADSCAGAMAKSLLASKFYLITNVVGVKDGNGNILDSLTVQDALSLIESGVIHSGMVPKINCAIDALDSNSEEKRIVKICDSITAKGTDIIAS